MYQRVGAQAFKKDLNNIKALCKHLDNPHKKFKSIHIAGTNGKGSTTHFTASILKEAGYKVGIYTSPHYKDFRERIKIGNEFITKKEVVSFVKDNLDIIKEIQPSFFEITVAMAFDHFAKNEVDVAVIEVGLGGRLDSTNVLKPLLSVITNISLDHQSMLGNTLKKIAREKAGIIKKNIPVIIGEKQKEVAQVFTDIAKRKSSKITFAKNLIKKEAYNKLLKKHPAPFQDRNINTALNIVSNLKKSFPKIKEKHIIEGISKVDKNVFYIGRWQTLSKQPLIIADSAHNEAGLQLNLTHLKSLKKKKIHFVLGFVNDKSLDSILSSFPQEATYYFAKANIPRGLAAVKLKEIATKQGLNGKAYSSVKRALASAKRKCKAGEMIYIGGSIFVVAELI
jgi:dihydrofolate synthase/folylpolyglutamate synthase